MLDIAEYSRAIDVIKPFMEDFNPKSPHTVSVYDCQVDDPRAKDSLMNESWDFLEELKLRPNSLSHDLTIEDLGQNKVWTHFKRLLLWDCNADKLAIKCCQFNKTLNSYPTTGYFVNRKEKIQKQDTKLSREIKRSSIRELKEVPLALILQSLKPDERSFHDLRSLDNEISQKTEWFFRGGLPETQGTNSEYKDLLIKLEKYKEKVLSKNNDERELNLYIEHTTTSEDYRHPKPKDDDDRKDKLESNNNIEKEQREEKEQMQEEEQEQEQQQEEEKKQEQEDEDEEEPKQQEEQEEQEHNDEDDIDQKEEQNDEDTTNV